MITKDNFEGALRNIIDSYVLPLLRSEMRVHADAALASYRTALIRDSKACCDRWLVFYFDMRNNSNFVPESALSGRTTMHWNGHTFTCCPFCGQRLDAK